MARAHLWRPSLVSCRGPVKSHEDTEWLVNQFPPLPPSIAFLYWPIWNDQSQERVQVDCGCPADHRGSRFVLRLGKITSRLKPVLLYDTIAKCMQPQLTLEHSGFESRPQDATLHRVSTSFICMCCYCTHLRLNCSVLYQPPQPSLGNVCPPPHLWTVVFWCIVCHTMAWVSSGWRSVAAGRGEGEVSADISFCQFVHLPSAWACDLWAAMPVGKGNY